MHTKSAAVCTRVETENGKIDFDDQMQIGIQDKFEAWSAQGYRVLGIATKSVDIQRHPFSQDDEKEMIFAGFLLFFDPPKTGVQDTILSLNKLGVQLKIITGDKDLSLVNPTVGVGCEV